MAQATSLVAGLTDRFTAVPKTHDLVTLGVSPAAISTYNALADHANNKTGECYPMLQSLARLLDRADKTIQRHVRQLVEAGLVEILERRRDKRGRFLGWRFRLPHLAAAAERIQEHRARNKADYEERKKKQEAERKARNEARQKRRRSNSSRTTTGHEEPEADKERIREEERQRRRRGYAWFFGEVDGSEVDVPPPEGTARVAEKESRRRSEDEVRQRRRGYDWFFGEAAAEPHEEDPQASAEAESSTSSSGHQCPVDSNKSLTNSEITNPPNPPRGAEDQEEEPMNDRSDNVTRPVSDATGDEGCSVTNNIPPKAQFGRHGALSDRASPNRPAAPGTEGYGGAPPLAGDAAWVAVVEALAACHKDGVPS